jgi:antitoxin component YwqK of YwqJK toxin-antitoxin module
MFYGCNRNSDLIIRGVDGKIVEKYTSIYDSSDRIKYISFHKNGTLKEEGHLHLGERDGIWKQYYNDGALRWLGKYQNGTREIPELDSTSINNTVIVKKGVTTDGYFAFRLILPDSLSHNDLFYTYTNADFRYSLGYDSCDFEIKPQENKPIVLKIYALNGDEAPIFGIKLDSLRLKSNR